jgi:DNA polymerase-3 subunit delta'
MQGGTVGTPPTIDACREIIRWTAYRPVLAARKVAVFFAADRMALPAANSVLKMAEEPQEYAYSIFLLSNPDLLLPTIRSRAWTISLQPAERAAALPPPSTAEEWIYWMEKNADTEVDGLVAQFAPWIRHEVENGHPEAAARLDRLRMLLKTGRLSQTMSFDLIVWALKEGIAFEHVFDDIW